MQLNLQSRKFLRPGSDIPSYNVGHKIYCNNYWIGITRINNIRLIKYHYSGLEWNNGLGACPDLRITQLHVLLIILR